MVYGSSLTDPNYSNFRGSQTGKFVGLPMSSKTNPMAANYTGTMKTSILGVSDEVPYSSNKLSSGSNVNQNSIISGAQQSGDAELRSLNSSFDYSKSLLEGQSSDLDKQFGDTQNFYTQQQNLLSGQVDTSKKQANDTAENNRADALATAQDVQRQNRNMLRALGILSSSAGGDLLSRPMGEYEKVRGQIATQLSNRLNELNDFMNAKTSELSYAAQQARAQYDTLKSKIANDLRFSERQRGDAIASATAALNERMNEIRMTLGSYASQTASAQDQVAKYISTLQGSNIGTIDTGNISDVSISPINNQNNSVTASIYQPEQKKRLSDSFMFS